MWLSQSQISSSGELLSLLLHKSLNLGSVGWIRNEKWKLFSHVNLGQIELMVEGGPELALKWLSSQVVDVQLEINCSEGSHGGLVSLVVLEVWSQSLVGQDELSNRKVVSLSKESQGRVSITLAEVSVSNSSVDGISESIFLIVSPDSSEVSFSCDLLWHLVWEEHSLWLDDLWSHLGNSIVLSLESGSTLSGSGVNTEVDWLLLICISERVKEFILLLRVQVTLVSMPPWLWNFIVEKSGRVTLSVLLKSEPLEWVWLLSLTEEWSWGGLGEELVHGLIPSLS